MTGAKRKASNIPHKYIARNVYPEIETSSTSGGPNLNRGTNSIDIGKLEYTDIPPPRKIQQSNWTLNNIGIVMGILIPIVSIIIFFYSMNLNISDIKADLKNMVLGVGNLNAAVDKQQTSIDNMSNSIERLENENRRTQDIIQFKKK